MQTSRDEAIRKPIKVFRTSGYEGTTLSLISQMRGLGGASLYHHFPKGKQEIVEVVLMYVYQEFCAIVLRFIFESAQIKEGEKIDNLMLKEECTLKGENLGNVKDSANR